MLSDRLPSLLSDCMLARRCLYVSAGVPSALFRCGSVVTERQALTASRYIGVTWRDLARRLGFLGAETDDFEYRADSLKEVSAPLTTAPTRTQCRTGATART